MTNMMYLVLVMDCVPKIQCWLLFLVTIFVFVGDSLFFRDAIFIRATRDLHKMFNFWDKRYCISKSTPDINMILGVKLVQYILIIIAKFHCNRFTNVDMLENRQIAPLTIFGKIIDKNWSKYGQPILRDQKFAVIT